MQDELVDAPKLELTAEPSAGEDALQLGPTDAPEAAANLGDAFSIKHKKAKADPILPMKASKPVTAAANDSVVAALMGLKLPSVKAQPATRVEPVVSFKAPAIEETVSTNAEFEASFVAQEHPVETDAPDRNAAAQAADLINERVEAPSDERIATPAPTLRLVYPPLEDEVTEAEMHNVAVDGTTEAKESEMVEQSIAPADPLPSPLPEYRERGPDAAAASTPKPRRAIPVAPQWPSDAPQARPSRRTNPLPAPAELPMPPEHLVPAARFNTPATAPDAVETAGPTGAWWTIPLTFVGIAIVACSILIPASDENRRANYELAKIEQDVDYFERQSAVNKDFLDRVNTDATLAERLAQRQLHQTRQGVKIAPMSGKPDAFGASPFAMTRLDPPQPLPAYQPVNDVLTDWFLGEERSQQMAAIGLVVAGAGVMLGGGRRSVA